MMHDKVVDTSTVSYITSGGTILIGGLTLNEWGIIIASCTAVGTFIVNWIYKHKMLKVAIKTGNLQRGDGD